MLEYLSLDIICSAKPTVFIELRSVPFGNCSLLGTNNLRRQNYEHISLQMKVKSAYEPTVASVLELIPVSIA